MHIRALVVVVTVALSSTAALAEPPGGAFDMIGISYRPGLTPFELAPVPHFDHNGYYNGDFLYGRAELTNIATFLVGGIFLFADAAAETAPDYNPLVAALTGFDTQNPATIAMLETGPRLALDDGFIGLGAAFGLHMAPAYTGTNIDEYRFGGYFGGGLFTAWSLDDGMTLEGGARVCWGGTNDSTPIISYQVSTNLQFRHQLDHDELLVFPLGYTVGVGTQSYLNEAGDYLQTFAEARVGLQF